MMGTEIDDNGIYQGWSDIFDYTNLQTLKASEKLPIPQNVELITIDKQNGGPTENAINIDQYVQEYIQVKDNPVERMNLYNKLIRDINKLQQETIEIYWEDDNMASDRGKLINVVNTHNSSSYNINRSSASLKNFISSNLQNIIQGTKNLIGSQSPITMDDLHSAADSAENQNEEWTIMNPAYIPLMQNQNMVGKKGVGIAANGQKASFIWKYWMTEEINNPGEFFEEVKFAPDFAIDRIEGRFGGSPINLSISCLPDINKYNASDENKLFFTYNTNHYVTSDLMSSQMISAATDNAKELILDRINANTDLAKVYMYLITLGFDVKDIVSFMTSPAIDLIARNSNSNIFLSDNFRTIDVANLILNKIGEQNFVPEEEGNTFNGESVPSITNSKYSFLISNKVNDLLKNKTPKQIEEIEKDVKEFIKIYKLSEEFSNAGRFLGLNQGVPTTKQGLIDMKSFIKNIIYNREKELGLVDKDGNVVNEAVDSIIPQDLKDLVRNFDVNKYLEDSDYRRRIIKYYDKIKGSLNVFALIESAPQFRTVLDILNIVNVMDKESSVKSQIFDYFYDKLKIQYPGTTSDYGMQLMPIINDFLIQEFLDQSNIYIPIQENYEYIDDKWKTLIVPESGNFYFGKGDFGLSTKLQLSSFHYMMDNFIIPKLKDGSLLDVKDNVFIQSLISASDNGKPKYKINLDMSAINNNSESKIQFKNILKGLQELQKYKFGNITLTDTFMLYSLIVDKNQEGSDRMTKIFQDFVNENVLEDNLLLNYYKFIGETDYSKSLVDKVKSSTSLNDILVLLALGASQERGHLEPSIKLFNRDGTIDYKYSVGYNKYKSFGDMLPIISGETFNEKLERLRRRDEYGLGMYYSEFIDDMIYNLSNPVDFALRAEAFNQAYYGGYLNFNVNC